jgi:hypothetical protein
LRGGAQQEGNGITPRICMSCTGAGGGGPGGAADMLVLDGIEAMLTMNSDASNGIDLATAITGQGILGGQHRQPSAASPR